MRVDVYYILNTHDKRDIDLNKSRKSLALSFLNVGALAFGHLVPSFSLMSLVSLRESVYSAPRVFLHVITFKLTRAKYDKNRPLPEPSGPHEGNKNRNGRRLIQFFRADCCWRRRLGRRCRPGRPKEERHGGGTRNPSPAADVVIIYWYYSIPFHSARHQWIRQHRPNPLCPVGPDDEKVKSTSNERLNC